MKENQKKKINMFKIVGVLLLFVPEVVLVISEVLEKMISYDKTSFVLSIVACIISILLLINNRIISAILIALYGCIDAYNLIDTVKRSEGFNRYCIPYLICILACVFMIGVIILRRDKGELIWSAIIFDLLLIKPILVYNNNAWFIDYAKRSDYASATYICAYIGASVCAAIGFAFILYSINRKNKIEEKTTVIEEIKPIVCDACGSENNGMAKFCDKCGKPITYIAYNRICRKCKTENAEGANNCMNCGNSLSTTQYKAKEIKTKKSNFNTQQYLPSIIVVCAFLTVLALFFGINVNSNKMAKIERGMTVEEVHKILGEPSYSNKSSEYSYMVEDFDNVYFAGVRGSLSVWYSYSKETVNYCLWEYKLVGDEDMHDVKDVIEKIENYLDSKFEEESRNNWEGKDGNYRLEAEDSKYDSSIKVWYDPE